MKNSLPKTVADTKESPDTAIRIGIATTAEEKREIYRFRYQTYVEEMSKSIEGIDHVNKLLYDELDDWTILLYAKVDSKLIATIRMNIEAVENFPEKLIEFLSLHKFKNSFTKNNISLLAYVTKLMILPSYRSSSVLYLLIAKCYELCCVNQIQFAFGACNFHLLRLYEKMGFHRYKNNFVDPGYGLLAPIVLLIDDVQHLRTVRSPLFRLARKRGGVVNPAVQWFHEDFTRHITAVNSQTVGEEELWSIVAKRLGCSPMEVVPLLRELSEAEAKKFFHGCGSYVQCEPGETITYLGDVSYSYNILLSGTLQSLTFKRPRREYASPGQPFGANGLTAHNRHTEDIAATTRADIFVLSGVAFQKFYHSYPDIAHKIVQSLIRLRNSK